MLFNLISCASTENLNSKYIRAWKSSLENEYPQENPTLAHYKRGDLELFYLAAVHSNKIGSPTLNLVEELFQSFQFNALIIEPIPFSSGQSPKWCIDESVNGRAKDFIVGGESALAVIYADEKHIPFVGGEPDHKDIYLNLRQKGYSDIDVVGFYLVLQIPQWVREKENKDNLLERKAPSFIAHYCKIFSSVTCPRLEKIKQWYFKHAKHELTADVSTEEVAPISDGSLFLQRISSDVGYVRDHFTLKIINQFLKKYKKLAVIYGAGHFITLRKSFDHALGNPEFIEKR